MDSVHPHSEAGRTPWGPHCFPTTQWSMVLAAGEASTEMARSALETLCRVYWYPLYAYVRRRGHSADDAQDLTQAFFVRLIEQHSIERADRDRGRFRSYLLGAMKYFLLNEQAKARAVRRGGDRVHFSIDAVGAEERYAQEPATHLTPEVLFMKRWATTVIEQALNALRQEYAQAGNRRFFERLKAQILGDSSLPYAEIGKEFGMKEGAVKTAVFRLRKRFAQALRAAIADTVSTPDEIEDELNALMGAFQR